MLVQCISRVFFRLQELQDTKNWPVWWSGIFGAGCQKPLSIVLYNARCEFRDVAKKHDALVQSTFFYRLDNSG